MNEDKTSEDFDDARILAKFNSLLSKYQNQGKIIGAAHPAAARLATASQVDDISSEIGPNKIPTLTEVVILRSSAMQSQTKRLTPMQLILNAALEDTNIEMNVLDRRALADALETRLADQIKNCG
jgi:hypothetical protein